MKSPRKTCDFDFHGSQILSIREISSLEFSLEEAQNSRGRKAFSAWGKPAHRPIDIAIGTSHHHLARETVPVAEEVRIDYASFLPFRLPAHMKILVACVPFHPLFYI